MKARITDKELHDKAMSAGLKVEHDCGGYRLVKDHSYVFPNSGVCPTTTKRECMTFLQGRASAPNTDREHIVQLNSAELDSLVAFVQKPNGGHSIGRLTVEAVCNGGLLVRTNPYSAK